MKMIARIPLFAVVFGFAFAASAQSAKPAVEQAESETPATPATSVADPSANTGTPPKAADDLANRNCLKHTGSRITPRADKQGRKCVSANGRSYSKEDLDRTGEIDLADALRRLDPAIR